MAQARREAAVLGTRVVELLGGHGLEDRLDVLDPAGELLVLLQAASVRLDALLAHSEDEAERAIRALAYDDHDSNIEALLLRWLEHGQPARFAAAPTSPRDPS